TVRPSNRLTVPPADCPTVPPPDWSSRIWRLTCRLADMAWWVGAAVLVVGPVLAGRLLGWAWMPMAFGCAAVAGVAAVIGRRLRTRVVATTGVAVAFALLYFPALFLGVLPRLDDLWLTRNISAMVARETQGRPGRVVSVGYTEPSMAFTFGTQTVLTGGVARAVLELQQNPAAVVLIQDVPAAPPRLLPMDNATWTRLSQLFTVPDKHRYRERFLAAAAQAGVPVREVAAVEGLNYSRTKRVRVVMYRMEGDGISEKHVPTGSGL
ncbi:MAG: hypothetical protein H7831_18295, partial [Magnetococcus sp. WYHC-3]